MTSVKAAPLVMGSRGPPPNPIRVAHSGNGTPAASSPRTPTASTAKTTLSAEELAHKKKLVEQRLREKEKRLSRLSQAINGNSSSSKQTQQDVNHMAEKLKKMQNLLAKNEQMRKIEEQEELKRQQEEERLKRLTKELEQHVDPGSLTRSQKDRRTRNLKSLILSVDGKITEEALDKLEQKERETDEKEKKERQEKLSATESKLKQINNKLREHAKAKEEQNLTRLQRQLELMESKLKDLEETGRTSHAGEDEVDEESVMRDWEEQNRLLRVEREKAVQKRKQETERRLRELQDMVEEKRKEREEKLEMLRNRKAAALEAELRDLDKPIEDDFVPYTPAAKSMGGSGGMPAPDWVEKIIGERLKALETQMQKRREQDEEEMKRKDQEIERRLRDLVERERAISSGGGGGGGGGGGSGGGGGGVGQAEFDMLKKMVHDLSHKVATGGGGGGGGGSGLNLSYEDLMKEIAETQRIIFDENSKENEIADANIRLEKLMADYEKTPEYMAQKEEKRLANEKLNKAALEKVKGELKGLSADALKRRLTDSPELKLIFMEPNSILKLHQNDFKQYALRGLSYEELRGLRGCLPTFKTNQTVQLGWQDSLEAKIEEMAASANKPKPPPKPKTTSSNKKWKKAPSAAKAGGDIFAEILARKKLGGGDDDDGPSAPAPVSNLPPAPVATNAPPPPMMKKMPPLPPPGPPAAASPPPPPPPGAPVPPPPPYAGLNTPPAPPPPATKSFVGGGARTSVAAMDANAIKTAVDDLVNMVFSGEAEADVVSMCRVVGEQIKGLTGDYKELAPKARFFILAIKEAMSARSGSAQEVAKAKQKLLVVVKSLKAALDEKP